MNYGKDDEFDDLVLWRYLGDSPFRVSFKKREAYRRMVMRRVKYRDFQEQSSCVGLHSGELREGGLPSPHPFRTGEEPTRIG